MSEGGAPGEPAHRDAPADRLEPAYQIWLADAVRLLRPRWRDLVRRLVRTPPRGTAVAAGALLGAMVLLVYLGTAPRAEPVRALPDPVPALPSALPGAGERSAGAGPATPGPPARPRLLPLSPLPIPTPSAAPPATASPPQAEPLVTVERSGVPDLVDLTAVGSLDWVHWGLSDARSVNRRAGGSGAIVDEGGPGGRGRYDNNPERFGWRDGTPNRSVRGTPTGVYTCGVGNGFALAVAAGPQTRTLRFYAGVWRAAGRLEVRLSTGGPTATSSLSDQWTNRTAEFVIRFRAPPGARLLIRWTTERSFERSCGNVDMQAAALS